MNILLSRACLTRVAVLICIFCALSLAVKVPSAAADGITVMLDGKPLSFDVMPQIINGHTMVPMNGIFEALGFTVTWHQEDQSVTATKSGLTIVMKIGNQTALKGLEKVALDEPPVIIQGRTMVPLRFVAESSGDYVSWDGEHQVIRISSNAATPPTGTPVAQGYYNPSQQLVLDAKVTPAVKMEIVLEPGALVTPAQVSLYAESADIYRLILGADPINDNIPGFAGFDGARIKAKFIETGSLFVRRPVLEANGEMIDNKVYYGKDADGNDTITSGIRVVERDTYLMVNEATDQQWAQVQVVY